MFGVHFGGGGGDLGGLTKDERQITLIRLVVEKQPLWIFDSL